jgi:hypothetical protein
MSKFKFKLKLQGLELEMEGSREDIPLIAQNLGNQLTGLIQPAADMAEGKANGEPTPLTINHSNLDATDKKKTRKRRPNSNGSTGSSNATDAKPIEWTHDSSKYGTPQQTWNTAKKSIWTMYVASQELQLDQLTAPQITDTFNRKFKQAGQIRGANVSRDLGNLKMKSPAQVGEDTTKSVSEWFLTAAGIEQAQEAIKETQQS